jgi:hypothetical protein
VSDAERRGFDASRAVSEAPHSHEHATRRGRAELLRAIAGAVVEHPGAVGVAARLETLAIAGAYKVQRRGCHARDHPIPIFLQGFVPKFDSERRQGNSSPHGGALKAIVKETHIACIEISSSRPLLEKCAEVSTKGDELFERRRVRHLRPQVVPIKEPLLPVALCQPVDGLAANEMVRERAVDEIDARELTRIGRGRALGDVGQFQESFLRQVCNRLTRQAGVTSGGGRGTLLAWRTPMC